jgi:tetratricopeptide (TPR) repeat protein
MEALNFNGDDISVLKKSGAISFQKNEKEKAFELYKKALQLDKRDLAALLMLCKLYLDSGKILKAYNLLIGYKDMYPVFTETETIELIPAMADSIIALGDVYLSADLYMEAKKIYELAAKITPNDAELNQKIAYSESQKEVPAGEIDILTLKLRLAELEIEKQTFNKAKIFLEDILLTDTKNVSALIDYGVLNALDDRRDEAIRFFKNVLELDPENEIAKENLEIMGS